MSFVPYAGGPDKDENEWWLEREISLIENYLQEEGESDHKTMGDALGCKYWGPTRYRNALKEGAKRGAFRRVSRGRFAPP